MKHKTGFSVFFLLAAMGVATQYAQAANLSVNCDKHDSIERPCTCLRLSIRKGQTR
jgi:hypothetical protein